MPKPDNSGRDHAGRWIKGVSGNRSGPRSGYRQRATLAAQSLLDGQAEALTQKAVELALEGDTAALRLCIERLLPPRKEAPITTELPELKNNPDGAEAIAALVGSVARGELTPSEGRELGALIVQFSKAQEVADLAQRLEALEAELRGRK